MRKDLTGKRYGMLLVVCAIGKNKHGQTLWKCICDCGKETVVVAGNLGNQHTRSCGCLQLSICSATHKIHGFTSNPTPEMKRTFKSWVEMRARCFNPKHKRFNEPKEKAE